jgi:very-short-patch-repair endonuclease
MDELSTVSFCRHLRKTMSKAEAVLWTQLRGRGINGQRFRRQHPIGPFIADFACVKARLVIEVDGDSHTSDEAQAYDTRRTLYLAKQGWRERRFTNQAVLENLNHVLAEIRSELSPPKQNFGGVGAPCEALAKQGCTRGGRRRISG